MNVVLIVKKGNPTAAANGERIRAALGALSFCVLAEEDLPRADVVIAVGGDGTIMHAAKQAAVYDKPVLGVNSGRVGFLAGLEPEETDLLGRLQTGDYQVEQRMLLEILYEKNGVPTRDYALNEVAVTRGGPARMIDIQVRESLNEGVLVYRADGLLAATPTGSTAYSLSAGGPVLDPQIEGIVLTPVCPYSLQARSLVFSSAHTLYVRAQCRPSGEIYACIDGEEPVEITGQEIAIAKAPNRKVRLIRLKTDPFFNAYKNKIIDRSV